MIILPDWIVKRENLPSNEVRLSHIQDLVNYQEKLTIKPAPFLKQNDIQPNHFEKMDTGSAIHVFHHDVAAALRNLVKKKGYTKDMLTTAYFIDATDRWFKLCSSRSAQNALSLKNPQKYAESVEFLNEYIKLIREVKIGVKGEWKPVQTGIQMSTTSILEIAEYLLKVKGFEFLLTSRLSQDKLENLFSQIRRRKKTPNCYEFKNALKIVTLAQFLAPVKGHNYENDDGGYFLDFLNSNPLAKADMKEVDDDEDFVTKFAKESPAPDSNDHDDELYNFCGYIVNSETKRMKLKCADCSKIIHATSEEIEENGFCTIVCERDFTGSSLVYCSPLVFNEIFKPCDSICKRIEKSLEFITKDGCCQNLIKIAMAETKDVLPSCHGLRARLVNRFITMRMKIIAKEITKQKIAEAKAKRSGSERGSRSSTMKKVTDELK